jgi:hypothetical protein
MRGIGTTSRGLLVGVVLVIVTVSNETVGLSAAILYAIAFTAELGVGLATYFGGEDAMKRLVALSRCWLSRCHRRPRTRVPRKRTKFDRPRSGTSTPGGRS